MVEHSKPLEESAEHLATSNTGAEPEQYSGGKTTEEEPDEQLPKAQEQQQAKEELNFAIVKDNPEWKTRMDGWMSIKFSRKGKQAKKQNPPPEAQRKSDRLNPGQTELN